MLLAYAGFYSDFLRGLKLNLLYLGGEPLDTLVGRPNPLHATVRPWLDSFVNEHRSFEPC
jgi:hypothetical protein